MRILIPLMLLLLSACSNLPVAIKEAPNPDLQLAQFKEGNATNHQGEKVRWGGQIVKVENNDSGSTLHIAELPLNSFGRPISERDSRGRFLAQTKDFVDPHIYESGTRITVAGLIADTGTIKVDQKTMTVPIVKIISMHRWVESSFQRDPYWRAYPYYYNHFGYGLSYPHWRTHWHYRNGYYW
ncbi:Slp family lipoprotein [Methylophaga sp.]|uniref:Slp family lipoprotein n=1 Tax=Methylophaga sp. TaxID=2024840 RepID=UPI003F69D43F